MGGIDEFYNQVAERVLQAGPSVVRVEGRRRGPSTGIVWDSTTVVTAQHTVEHDEGIVVGLPDGKTATATLHGRDPATDLAVLKVDAGGLQPAKWAASADLKVGHLSLALGRPGRSVRASLGILSVVGDEWRSGAGGRVERYLETDHDLPRGFSGGPLVNPAGHFIGLNTSGLQRGASLALPAETVKRVTEELLARGSMQRGFLGISSYPVRLPDELAKAAGQPAALLIFSVKPGSPADQAGLILGDVLTSLHGTPVGHIDDLLGLLDGDRVGAATTARVIRAGQLKDIAITVGGRG